MARNVSESWAWLCLAACCAAAGCSKDESKPAAASVKGDAGDAHVGPVNAGSPKQTELKGPPPEVQAASKEWPLANRDYAGTRATTDSKITKANIATLAEAWSFELPAGGMFGSASAAPLVLNGAVYYLDNQSNVFVLDAATGALRWDKHYDSTGALPSGLAVGWGKVFFSSSDHSFAALDVKDGKELWKSPIEVPDTGGIGPAPVVYDGLVYTSSEPVNSTVEYGGGVNGTLYALDQESGEVVWKLETIKDPGLWGNEEINSGGGAWYPPTIDVERNAMYWGIGNPGPYPGTKEFPLGTSREGDNLYTNSVLSVGLRDGEVKWFHQESPHDLFDLDFQNPPIPFTIEVDGAERHFVVGSGKVGTVVVLDADKKGEVVWRAEVGKHENDDLKDIPEAGVLVFPGSLGGVLTPLAVANETIFVPVVNFGRRYTPTEPSDFDDKGSGELLAFNAADGTLKWKKDLLTPAFGSVTVVNDVVLTSSYDGTVYAFDRESGDEVWRFKSDIGINGPISVVDDTVIIPAGLGVGKPRLIALRLP